MKNILGSMLCIKKVVSILIVHSILITAFPALIINVYAETSGTCGDNIQWTLDSNGTLIVSGFGEMNTKRRMVPEAYDAIRIKKVIIGDGITTIGRSSFYDCKNLREVLISNTVTQIDSGAFGNTALTRVYIPSNVKAISARAFTDCNELECIDVAPDNKFYKSIDGNLYSYDTEDLIKYAIGKKNRLFIVPDGTRYIGSYAFCHSKLYTIILPESIGRVGESAFEGSKNLSNLIILNSEWGFHEAISNASFNACLNLKNVYFAGNQKQWDDVEDDRDCNPGNSALFDAKIHLNSKGPVYLYDEASSGNKTEYIRIYLNNKLIDFDVAPVIRNGRTLVPIRAIAEALGSSVSWNEKNQTAVLQRGLETVVFQIGKNKVYANKIQKLDVEAQIINNRTFIPLRAISEIFGGTVEWNDKTKEIHISCVEYTDEHVFRDFKTSGFLQFNYFANSFVDEHIDTSFFSKQAWSIALSNISSWGERIITFQLKDYEKDLYKEVITTMLSNISGIESIDIDAGIAEDVLSGVSKTAKLSSSDLQKRLKSYTEKQNSNTTTALSTATKARFFKYFCDGLDIVNDGIDHLSFTYEEIAYLLTDYTQNMYYLESIKNATKEYDTKDNDLIKAIEELEKEYAQKYTKVLRDISNKALEAAGGKGISALLNLAGSSAGSLYSLTTFGIEATAKLSGMANYAENVENAIALFNIENNLKCYTDDLLFEVYDSTSNTLRPNVTESDWHTLVTCFRTTQACTLETYKCMLAVTNNSIEKVYLEKQIEILEKIRIQTELPSTPKDMFYFAD